MGPTITKHHQKFCQNTMVTPNLQKATSNLFKLSRNSSKRNCTRLLSSQPEQPRKILSRKTKTDYSYHDKTSEEVSDYPIQFSTSDAARSAGVSDSIGLGGKFSGGTKPEIQNSSMIISLFCFMIYFFILREESDLDLYLTTDPSSMYEKMPGLERIHLKSAIKNYEIEGRDTSELTKRLEELEKESS